MQENSRKATIEEVYGVVNSPKPKQSTRADLKDWANSVILEEKKKTYYLYHLGT